MDERIKYECGCTRCIDTKATSFCDAHARLQCNYADMLARKRRLKEDVRRGDASAYQKRRLCQLRKDKKAFWAAMQECPREEPRAIGV